MKPIFFLNKRSKNISVKRYCVQQLEIGKGFEDINLVWSFADQNEDGNNFNTVWIIHNVTNERSDVNELSFIIDIDVVYQIWLHTDVSKIYKLRWNCQLLISNGVSW